MTNRDSRTRSGEPVGPEHPTTKESAADRSDGAVARPPVVVAVEMGYGHLRAAHALAASLDQPVDRADRAPFAGRLERIVWSLARRLYEGISRASQGRLLGPLMRHLLDNLTRIGPPPRSGDPTRPTLQARCLAALVRRGFGHGVVEAARAARRPLLTTFFVPALAAQTMGHGETFCLVTDTDASRAWVPEAAPETRITFLAPCRPVVERLRSYGVPESRIVESGFPLPECLLGGPDLPALRENLAGRLLRLDPKRAFLAGRGAEIERLLDHSVAEPLPRGRVPPPLLTYAVGGAGAQADLARRILDDLRPAIAQGRLRLCLVAGARVALARRFEQWIERAGLESALAGGSVSVLAARDLEEYFDKFHRLLGMTDVLWTKPSEMTFFAALGLPLLLAPPVGGQELANRRWVVRAGVALPRPAPEGTATLLAQLLDRGALAAAAWAGFERLRADGLYQIHQIVAERRILAERSGEISSPTPLERSCPAPSIRSASSS